MKMPGMLYGVRLQEPQQTREYCGLDPQRCLGMGYLLGVDCNEIDKEESQLCVVDRLVLPFVSIVFGNANDDAVNTKLEDKFKNLRHHCTRAFALSFRNKRDMPLFLDVCYHLTRPYEWVNKETRRKVFEYANSLLWLVFGMTEEGDGRGFETVEQYEEHSQCAVYLAKELFKLQKQLLAYMITAGR